MIFLVALFFLFRDFNFGADGEEIEIDDNNTEIVIDKKDIEEIQSKLDELDIDLDDVINELEL